MDVSKGLVIGIIAAPLSLFGVGLAEGYAMSSLLKLGMPAFIFAATVAGALAFFAEKTAQVCLLVSRFLVGGFILLLAVALSVKITFATLSVLHGVVKHAIFAGVYR